MVFPLLGPYLRKSIFSVFFLSVLAVHAQNFVTGQAARAEIGQARTFTSGESGTAQNLLGGASGLAYANGTLWVADSNRLAATPQNNRVVGFAVNQTNQIPGPYVDLTQVTPLSSECGLCGYLANTVVGQPDFVTSNPGRAATATPANGSTAESGSMSTPTAIATDGTYLAVADTDNNRVLIWNSIPTGTNAAPNVVLGQTNFTSFQTPQVVNANSLRGPQGVWIQNGALFVADTQNYRVLIWKHIPTQNNQAADLVLGQPNFNTANGTTPSPGNPFPSTAANMLLNPVSVTSDGNRLYVADLGNNRVLIWNNAFVNGQLNLANDQNADVAIGQPLLTTSVPNWGTALCAAANSSAPCAATLNFPRFALSDGKRLFVADGGNDRVLIFNTIPTQNGASADTVLGQVDFVTDQDTSASISITSTVVDNTSAVNITPNPTSLAFDGTNLYVADPFNRRVLVFTPADTPLPPESAVNWASEIIRQEGIVSFSVPSGGAITAGDTVTITIQGTGYTYTIVKNDNLDTIAQGIVKAINSSNSNAGDPNATAIFAGTGTGTVYLASKGTNLAFDSITLAASTSNSVNLVATASGSYLTAGNAGTGAAGMLVEINGNNLADSSAQATRSGTLPTSLGGVQVFMDGFATPLLSVSPTQVITEIPFNFTNGSLTSGSTVGTNALTDRNSTSIYVRTQHSNGSVTITNATPMYIAPANPGLFNAPAFSGQPRPWPAINATHQPGNATAVVSVDGTVTAGNTATITIGSANYTYTVASGDSLLSIAQNLTNQINASDQNVTAALGGAFQRIVLTAKQPGAAGTGISVMASASANATVTLTPYTSSTCCNVVPGSPITPDNPAVPGELIQISATGLGTVQDVNGNKLSVTTGQPWTGGQNSASNSVTATMGGVTAQVITAGLAQNGYGMYDIQMIVPSGAATNAETQLFVAQNAFISNTVTIPVGPANPNYVTPPPASSSPISASLDSPQANSTVAGTINIAGWALDASANISTVTIFVDGVNYGQAGYGGQRSDVCAMKQSPNCPNVGFNFGFDTTQLADGPHVAQARITASDGTLFTVASKFTTANQSSDPAMRVFIDQPSPSNTPLQGGAMFMGWAVDDNASITAVKVSIDGKFIGNATYGMARPDVCNVYPGRAGCPNVGWSLLVDTTVLANGTHTVYVQGVASDGEQAGYSANFQVANFSSANNPLLMSIDSPSSSSAYSGMIVIGGWALQLNAKITGVSISIDGVQYSGIVFYGGARPDVCNAVTSANCPNVGWDALLDTTILADGTHTIALTATNALGQNQTVTKQFQVANLTGSNPMHTFIDLPNLQNPVSGTARAMGWAISDNAAISSVQISVDGVPFGSATYGASRPDVCQAYPGRAGCPNVGWSYAFDTTTLTNGQHTLQATATSVSGSKGTVGAPFTVLNPAATSNLSINISQPNAVDSPFQGIATFSGTVSSSASLITAVGITVDGFYHGNASLSGANSLPENATWSFTLDTGTIANGTHTLGVIAYPASGAPLTNSAAFSVTNWSSTGNPMTIQIDSPSTSNTVSGTLNFGGWIIDTLGVVSTVSVTIDGVPCGGATYGNARPDVCSILPGSPGCPNIGWNMLFDTRVLSNGPHTIAVTANAGGGQSYTQSGTFSVLN